LFVAGECLAEGPRQTLQTMLHEAVLALAHARRVNDTSRGGKYHNTFRRLGLLGGQGQEEGQDGQGGDGQQPTGKAGERFKVTCGCQPPRSFWIRAKQYTPGPITCGVCGQDFQPQNASLQPQAGWSSGMP
jgi:hypothetical protein